LVKRLADQTKKEVFEKAQEWRFPWAMVQTPEDLAKYPQLDSRDFYVDIEHPKAGKSRYPGALSKMFKTPWQARMPAPLLGQHNKEIYGELLEYDDEYIRKLHDQGII